MTSQRSEERKISVRETSYSRCRSRDYSPSSTQVTIEQDDASTIQKESTRNKRGSNGDETDVVSQKYDYRRETRRSSSSETSSSSAGEASSKDEKPKQDGSSKERYNKTKTSRKYREYQPSSSSRPRERSPRARKTPERVPYFTDPKREEDRLRRKYSNRSRPSRRSTSRSRRRSRARSYSRERRRGSRRSKSRERRRSSSYDRHRSRRRSHSPSRHHQPPMLIQGAPPFIPMVPVPYPPQFVPAPFAPRFPPGGMIRPPFPPPMVYYVPHPLIRPMGRWMNGPPRPRRNY